MAEQAGNSDLILENREKLTVTGVRRVLQCNAESAAIETARIKIFPPRKRQLSRRIEKRRKTAESRYERWIP